MALKDELLKYFTRNPGEYTSGEELAKKFNVSRAAVWKAVSVLKDDGFDIISSPSKGYCFSASNDFLSSEAIHSLSKDTDAPVYVFETIDSTNNYARILTAQNAPHGTLIVANHQSAGRGRQGHTFYSPKNLGLYFSLIVHPKSTQYISRITPAAAVSAVHAIEKTSGLTPGIKWVNDLFIQKKKIAGILCEAISDFESGTISAVIIGIGINVRPMKFPEELDGIADSLNSEALSRNALAAELRNELLYWMDHLDDPDLMEQYRRYSVILGKEILYTINNVGYHGIAKGINDDGNLLIEKEDGSIQLLQSGEISVKDW